MKGNIDVLMTSGTSYSNWNSFPIGNFLTNGFSSPHRLDLDSMNGGILLNLREDIP